MGKRIQIGVYNFRSYMKFSLPSFFLLQKPQKVNICLFSKVPKRHLINQLLKLKIILQFKNLVFYCFSSTIISICPPSLPYSSPILTPTFECIPFGFVHVSFIVVHVVPVIPSPHCPLPTPPCPLLDCS